MSQLGYANDTAFESEKLDAVITVSGSKGSNASGNVPKYFNTGAAVRVYGGDTFTISAADGYAIKTIIITTSADSYGITASNVEITNGTIVVNGITVTITATDGEEDVVITNPASKGNVRIVSIEVVYEKVSTTTTPEGDVNTETGDTPNVEQDTENT
jgi:hypothetical protein